jgi:hypothetical protein
MATLMCVWHLWVASCLGSGGVALHIVVTLCGTCAGALLVSAPQQGIAARHCASWHCTENVVRTIAHSVQGDLSGVFRAYVCVSDNVLIACTCSCCNLLSHLPALPCHMQFANSGFCRLQTRIHC